MYSSFIKYILMMTSELTLTYFRTMLNLAKIVFVLIVSPDIR